VCFLMTTPNFSTPLDDVELRPRVDGNLSANVIAAFSNSTRIPVSRTAAVASEAADAIVTLLRQNPHASLRQFSNACTNEAQGMAIGEAADLDLATTPAQIASQQPPAVRRPEASPPEGAPALPPTPAPVPVVPTAPQPPPQPVDFDIATRNAAATLLSKMPPLKPGEAPRKVVIDPLIDGYSGARNVATTKMGGMISDLLKDVYRGLTVAPFNSNELANQPLVLIGTFQAVNSRNEADGPADVFGICLALTDLKTGRIVSKADARAWAAGIDTTPVPFFQDSPIWLHDEATTAYIKSCQGSRIGDPINPDYADRILVAAEISDAIDAYDSRRYADAADLWQNALRSPGGNQLRAYNGLYLANSRLNRRERAEEAFAALVDYGLEMSTVGVTFLFEQNSTLFYRRALALYEMWLRVIASRSAARNACLQVVGYTSGTGIAANDDWLSVRRAQYVRDKLIDFAPSLANRTIVTGVGSREVIVRANNDGSDNALDRRRFEIKLVKCG
jgi:outer membrane protein OmpA-like peptidoglycan-associated protein